MLPHCPLRSVTRLAGLLLVALSLLVTISRAQEDSGKGKEKEVKKHYLTFQIGFSGSAGKTTESAWGRSETKMRVDNAFTGRVEVVPENSYDLPAATSQAAVEALLAQAAMMRAAVEAGDADKLKKLTPPSVLTWFPKGDQVALKGTIIETMTSSTTSIASGEHRAAQDDRIENYRAEGRYSGSLVNASVKINAEKQTYDLQFTLMPDMATTMEAVTQHVIEAHREEGNNRDSSTRAQVPLDMGPGQMALGYSNYMMVAEAKGLPLAGEANELLGHARIPVPRPDGWVGSWDVGLDVSWQIDVTLPPVELVITAPGYDEWRPEATLEGGAGPTLEVTARIETAQGAKPKVRVKQFIWELEDTSFEPGVAMNYPVQAGGIDFDLNLDATGGHFELSPNKQKVTRTVSEGYQDSVKVVPYDWGAWAKLQVTAVLADGRRIRGKLQGKPEYGLRVPKRAPDSKIADVWKEKNKSGADDLDDENEPEGDGNKGDGFTLYEEYRGFIVKGQHVDGDPRKKDFFVMNLIGADAEMGIGLFEALSEFQVHRLERNEMHTVMREMNTNRAKGAHNNDQHGVVLGAAESASALAGQPAEVFGAMTYSTDEAGKGLVFQPASTKIIGILPEGHPESLFSKPGNLSASDWSVTFYRAVAHELMHSVGVEEHGDGDGAAEFIFISPINKKNSVGRPYYAFKDSPEKPVPLLNEQGHDMAAIVYPRYAVERVKWLDFYRGIKIGKPGDVGYPRMREEDFQQYCEYEMESTLALSGQVGAEHGQHAGDQDCIMRYHFASFYPFTGRRDAFYMIEPGTEKLGLTLCRSPAGTGVNASGHPPQSRHGDAWPGTGDCAAKICPNDAVTPRKSALPVK